MKRSNRLGIKGLLVVGFWLAGSMTAYGQTIQWSNASGGNFATGANWTGGVAPTSIQTANFGTAGNYGVTFAGPAITSQLTTTNGDVTFNLGGNTYAIGSMTVGASGSASDLTLLSGEVFSTGTISVFGAAGSTLTVGSGARLVTQSFVTVSQSATPSTLLITNGGIVRSTGNGVLGLAAGTNGTLQIFGAGSEASFDGGMSVGSAGRGTIDLRDGSSLTTRGGVSLAGQIGSIATISISQSGTVWNHIDGNISTGSGSAQINIEEGTLNISNANSRLVVGNASSLNIGTIGGISGATINIVGDGSGISINSGGTMAMDLGVVNISGTNVGSLSLNSGGTLTQTSGTIATSSFTRAGTFNFNRGSFVVDGGLFNNSSGTFSLGGTGSVSLTMQNGATTTGLTALTVGSTNTAFAREFHVLSGSTLNTTGTSIVGSLGSGSLLRVNGVGSTWNSNGLISVGSATGSMMVENGGFVTSNGNLLITGATGAGSVGTLTIQSGGRVDAGVIELSRIVGSVTTATVTGVGSQLNASTISIGGTSSASGGSATMNINDGAAVTVNGITRVRSAGTLNLSGGTLTTQGYSRDATGVLNFNDGTLHVTAGTLSNNSGDFNVIGSSIGQNPTLLLSGNTSTAGITNLNVGSSTQEGTVTINAGATLGTGAVTIAQRGVINLDGGTLGLASITKTGTFNWNSGTVRFNNGATANDATLTSLLGSAHSLGNGQTISSLGTLTLGGNLALNGGAVTGATTFNNDATLTVNQGAVIATTLNNNAGKIIQVNGTASLTGTNAVNNSGTMRLTSETASVSGGAVTNNTSGSISGTGQINGDFDNQGTVRVTGSEHLVFTGTTNRNVLNMNLSGGTLQFTQSLFNRDGAAITGRGTFIGSSANPGGLGLTNEGLLSLSAGTTDIYGDVVNDSTGRIVTGGVGITTFFDDVTHNGVEIRTFAGSRTVFFGNQGGAGSFTGTGVVEYAGDLRPGNSPANVSYEGDVFLNSSAGLFVELGGVNPGSQYDRLTITGSVTVDGQLNVATINGFAPMAGQQFVIIDNLGIDPIQGTFAGLSEGAQFVSNGELYQLSYFGGTGNDLVISAVPEPTTWAMIGISTIVAGWYGYRRMRQNSAVSDVIID